MEQLLELDQLVVMYAKASGEQMGGSLNAQKQTTF
jgi:hypothetical protein